MVLLQREWTRVKTKVLEQRRKFSIKNESELEGCGEVEES